MKNELPATSSARSRSASRRAGPAPGRVAPYRRSPFRYALRFESDVARTDEELADLEHRMWTFLYEKLGDAGSSSTPRLRPLPAAATA